MKSKIHPFAVIFSIVTILLSFPAFLMAYNLIDDYTRNPANIFIVIMMFFGLLSISFFVFGWRNLRQVKVNDNFIVEQWLGRWNLKKLPANENMSFYQKSSNFRLFKIYSTIVEDQTGQQIHFNSFDFRNYTQLNQHLNKHIKSEEIKPKTAWIDKVFIGLFISASTWMIITGILKITF